jgi:pimeloyl-ACP methyl ester carboxylesterase
MSERPILLFLHGVTKKGQQASDDWRGALSESLRRLGYPSLDDNAVAIVAPRYAHALRGFDYPVDMPPFTVDIAVGEELRYQRRAFDRRAGEIEQRLGRHERGRRMFGAEQAMTLASRVLNGQFEQALKYTENQQIRAGVLSVILRELLKVRQSGRLVIIGHSLGSVIAADLIRRLPRDFDITGFVTIGSPLSQPTIHGAVIEEALDVPPANLAWWVNVWNRGDLVTSKHGIQSVFKWAVDIQVGRLANPINAHSASHYLTQHEAAKAVGIGLFDPPLDAPSGASPELVVPLDWVETLGLLGLRKGHLTAQRLSGDKQMRYRGALREVQRTNVEQLRARCADDGRSVPPAIEALVPNGAGSATTIPEPRPVVHLGKYEAAEMLIAVSTANVLRPYEVDVDNDLTRQVIQDLAVEMKLGRQYGLDIWTAVETAHTVLAGKRSKNWMKWAAIAVGATAVVAATGGLVLLAAPGVAGAAALTSSLAAFGPGGMLGGLITAGTLVGAGSGSVAVGLASPKASAEVVEAWVAAQLAVAIVRQQQGIEQGSGTWTDLDAAATVIRTERERLSIFSDESGAYLSELQRKLDAIDRALKHLGSMGLAPVGPSIRPGSH